MSEGKDNMSNTSPAVKKEQLLAVPERAVHAVSQLHHHLKYMWAAMALVMIALVSVIIWQKIDNKKQSAYEFAVLTDVKNNWTLKDKGVVQQKLTYRNFMLNIHRVYGVKYKVRKDRTYGMKFPKEVSAWIDMNYAFSRLLKFGPYDIPIMQILETSLDPHAAGSYGEEGMSQIKYGTAILALNVYKKMTPGMQRALARIAGRKIDFKEHVELKDYALTTALHYILLWGIRSDFDYNEMWYTSIYHWGGFLYRHYDKGRGQLPRKFIINKIEYNVAAYYCRFKEIQETFEAGALEPAQLSVDKWHAERRRLLREEVQLNTAYKELNRLNASFKKLKVSHDHLMENYKNMEKQTKIARAKFKKIYGEAKHFSGRDIRVLLKKGKGHIRQWQKEVDVMDTFDFYKWWSISILAILLFLCFFVVGARFVVLVVIDKLKDWKKSIRRKKIL